MQKRLISIAVILAIVLPLIILGGLPFVLLIGLISVIIAKELTDLYRIPNVVKLAVVISLIMITFHNFDSSVLGFGLDFYVISLSLLILLLPIIFFQIKDKYTTKDAFEIMGFVLLLGIGLNYLILIRDLSLAYFLMLILIPIITDTFAFTAGKLIGNHKATKLSPNKTWEGYIIGSLMGTFIMTVYYQLFIGNQTNLILLVGMILLMTIIAQLGDLFFSAIKRQNNIKDFSNLIPGHGGVIDRLDSIIFAALIFVILLGYL